MVQCSAAPVAQLAARGSHNPKVASSTLAGSRVVFCFCKKNNKGKRKEKDSTSGNRTRGVCVTGRNVTNYTNADKPPTRFELVTFRLLSECSAN